jgi:hypothetical protein
MSDINWISILLLRFFLRIQMSKSFFHWKPGVLVLSMQGQSFGPVPAIKITISPSLVQTLKAEDNINKCPTANVGLLVISMVAVDPLLFDYILIYSVACHYHKM